MTLTITFVKSDTNGEKAITGDLTLRDGEDVVIKSTAFSGGASFNPIDDGLYRLHLDIRGGESTNELNPDYTLRAFYGIQKVSSNIVDDHGRPRNGQTEWGTIRARLNPTGGAPDHGDYIHGKKRARDYTHGCICDRSERILNYLWNLGSPPAVIDVTVSGGREFDLESLVHKNPARKLRRNATKIKSKK